MKTRLALTLLFTGSGFVPLYERIHYASSAKAAVASKETVAVFPDFFRTLLSPVADSDVVISLLYFGIAVFFLLSLWRKKKTAAYTQLFSVILLNAFALIYLLRPLNDIDPKVTIVTGAGYYVYCALLLAFDVLCFFHLRKRANTTAA